MNFNPVDALQNVQPADFTRVIDLSGSGTPLE
jgi:hypothetical protein